VKFDYDPAADEQPYLIEFEGKAIASIQTVIETGSYAELHILFLTGETLEVAEDWLKIRSRGPGRRVRWSCTRGSRMRW